MRYNASFCSGRSHEMRAERASAIARLQQAPLELLGWLRDRAGKLDTPKRTTRSLFDAHRTVTRPNLVDPLEWPTALCVRQDNYDQPALSAVYDSCPCSALVHDDLTN